jgi:hypothetical protein
MRQLIATGTAEALTWIHPISGRRILIPHNADWIALFPRKDNSRSSSFEAPVWNAREYQVLVVPQLELLLVVVFISYASVVILVG